MMFIGQLQAALLVMPYMIMQSPQSNNTSLPLLMKQYDDPSGTLNDLLDNDVEAPNTEVCHGAMKHGDVLSTMMTRISNIFDLAMTAATSSLKRFRNNDVLAVVTTIVYEQASITISSIMAMATTTVMSTGLLALCDSVDVLMHKASNHFRSSLSLTPTPVPDTMVTTNNNKNWSTMATNVIAATIDPRYMDYTQTAPVDPCNLIKYDLGLPYGLFADRFWKTSHVPVCIPKSKTTCANFAASPIQFWLDIFSRDEDEKAQRDSLIPRHELDEAIKKWVADETELITASLYKVRLEIAMIAGLLVVVLAIIAMSTFRGTARTPMDETATKLQMTSLTTVQWVDEMQSVGETWMLILPAFAISDVPGVIRASIDETDDRQETLAMVSWVDRSPSVVKTWASVLLAMAMSIVAELVRYTSSLEPHETLEIVPWADHSSAVIEATEFYELLATDPPLVKLLQEERSVQEDITTAEVATTNHEAPKPVVQSSLQRALAEASICTKAVSSSPLNPQVNPFQPTYSTTSATSQVCVKMPEPVVMSLQVALVEVGNPQVCEEMPKPVLQSSLQRALADSEISQVCVEMQKSLVPSLLQGAAKVELENPQVCEEMPKPVAPSSSQRALAESETYQVCVVPTSLERALKSNDMSQYPADVLPSSLQRAALSAAAFSTTVNPLGTRSKYSSQHTKRSAKNASSNKKNWI